MKREVTIWDMKVAQAIAYFENSGGNEQVAYASAAHNNEQIDDAQWKEALKKYKRQIA